MSGRASYQVAFLLIVLLSVPAASSSSSIFIWQNYFHVLKDFSINTHYFVAKVNSYSERIIYRLNSTINSPWDVSSIYTATMLSSDYSTVLGIIFMNYFWNNTLFIGVYYNNTFATHLIPFNESLLGRIIIPRVINGSILAAEIRELRSNNTLTPEIIVLDLGDEKSPILLMRNISDLISIIGMKQVNNTLIIDMLQGSNNTLSLIELEYCLTNRSIDVNRRLLADNLSYLFFLPARQLGPYYQWILMPGRIVLARLLPSFTILESYNVSMENPWPREYYLVINSTGPYDEYVFEDYGSGAYYLLTIHNTTITVQPVNDAAIFKPGEGLTIYSPPDSNESVISVVSGERSWRIITGKLYGLYPRGTAYLYGNLLIHSYTSYRHGLPVESGIEVTNLLSNYTLVLRAWRNTSLLYMKPVVNGSSFTIDYLAYKGGDDAVIHGTVSFNITSQQPGTVPAPEPPMTPLLLTAILIALFTAKAEYKRRFHHG